MGKDHVPVFQQHRHPSASLSSFQVTNQQHKNRDSFINQMPNNNKPSK